jgi:AcrR family transcriptional regulator
VTEARSDTPIARRTQAERKQSTLRKLFDATTDSLVEQGYAGATVQAICTRAGVSQGALFRHFPTREALLVAVAEDVAGRALASFRESIAHEAGDDPVLLAMKLVRRQCRSRQNQAFYELVLASRTNPDLSTALRPLAKRYYDDIERLARDTLPNLAAQLGPRFRVLVDTVVCVFDGETLHRMVLVDDELDDARLLALRAALEPLLR